MKRLICFGLAAVLLPVAIARQGPRKEMALDPVIQQLGTMVGGVWRGELPGPKHFVVEFTYDWNPDHRGIRSHGKILKGMKNEIDVQGMIGWDPLAKKVYYLDCHGSEEVYFGHIHSEGKDIIFEFGPAGGDMTQFGSIARLLDNHTYQFSIKNAKTGKLDVALTLHRDK